MPRKRVYSPEGLAKLKHSRASAMRSQNTTPAQRQAIGRIAGYTASINRATSTAMREFYTQCRDVARAVYEREYPRAR